MIRFYFAPTTLIALQPCIQLCWEANDLNPTTLAYSKMQLDGTSLTPELIASVMGILTYGVELGVIEQLSLVHWNNVLYGNISGLVQLFGLPIILSMSEIKSEDALAILVSLLVFKYHENALIILNKRFPNVANQVINDYGTLLHLACATGNLAVVISVLQQLTIEEKFHFLQFTDSSGLLPLHYAVHTNNIYVIRLMVNTMETLGIRIRELVANDRELCSSWPLVQIMKNNAVSASQPITQIPPPLPYPPELLLSAQSLKVKSEDHQSTCSQSSYLTLSSTLSSAMPSDTASIGRSLMSSCSQNENPSVHSPLVFVAERSSALAPNSHKVQASNGTNSLPKQHNIVSYSISNGPKGKTSVIRYGGMRPMKFHTYIPEKQADQHKAKMNTRQISNV